MKHRIISILCLFVMMISTTAVRNQTDGIVRATDAVEAGAVVVTTASRDIEKTVYKASGIEVVESNDTVKKGKTGYKTRFVKIGNQELSIHEEVEPEEGVAEAEIQDNSEQEETATTVLENQNIQEDVGTTETEKVVDIQNNSKQEETVTETVLENQNIPIQEEVRLAKTEGVENQDNSEQEETVTTETQSVNEETVEDETQESEPKDVDAFTWDGPVLNARIGVVEGPSGKETYYNLNMKKIVSIMRDKGFSEEEYPYYIREDGVKMLGDYVMCAACFDIRPRGTIVETSLGMGIVCDTGGFALKNKYQLDIAVDW